MRGYVYFVQCGEDDGPIKIGSTADVDKRLSQLQVGCPFDLTLLASILVEDAEEVERELHARFRSFHIRGEWFEGSYALRSAVVQMSRLSADQRTQLLTSGDSHFEWRNQARESVEMPNPDPLTSYPAGSRSVPRTKQPPARARGRGHMWRGKWRPT